MPKGKLPFIGIVFDNVREACTLNEDLINSPPTGHFTLTFLQPVKNKVDLKIVSEGLKVNRSYKDVSCNATQLENFLYINRMSQDFNFSHILRDFDREFVVTTRASNKPFVLRLKGIYMMS
jgi:hypothetical protein